MQNSPMSLFSAASGALMATPKRTAKKTAKTLEFILIVFDRKVTS